jgi:hypothetical protein
MNKFDKNMVLEKYNDDIELIKYISEILNIHIERLKIIEKKNDNIEKIIITNNQFILNINDNEIINKDIHLQEYQENKTITNYIIVQDIIQNNVMTYDKKKYEVSNSIIIINDKNILSKEYCNEVIGIIDEVIESKKNKIEKWERNQNVNCLFFYSDSKNFIGNEKIKKLEDTIFKIISKLVGCLEYKFYIKSTGDSGYCFRKIYGPTRIHIDGVIINPINNRLSVKKVRNMSIIIALNSDYEGGEFYFPKQDYRIKLKQGDIICFPPYYTHPHMVDPVLNRTYRYTINTWLYE